MAWYAIEVLVVAACLRAIVLSRRPQSFTAHFLHYFFVSLALLSIPALWMKHGFVVGSSVWAAGMLLQALAYAAIVTLRQSAVEPDT